MVKVGARFGDMRELSRGDIFKFKRVQPPTSESGEENVEANEEEDKEDPIGIYY